MNYVPTWAEPTADGWRERWASSGWQDEDWRCVPLLTTVRLLPDDGWELEVSEVEGRVLWRRVGKTGGARAAAGAASMFGMQFPWHDGYATATDDRFVRWADWP